MSAMLFNLFTQGCLDNVHFLVHMPHTFKYNANQISSGSDVTGWKPACYKKLLLLCDASKTSLSMSNEGYRVTIVIKSAVTQCCRMKNY